MFSPKSWWEQDFISGKSNSFDLSMKKHSSRLKGDERVYSGAMSDQSNTILKILVEMSGRLVTASQKSML